MKKQRKRSSRRRERDLRWLFRLERLPSDMGNHRRKKIEGVKKTGKNHPAFWDVDNDTPPRFSVMAKELPFPDDCLIIPSENMRVYGKDSQ